MDIKFSTTGIRGISNEDMTADLALKLGKTFGTFMNGKGTVLIAQDPRTSSEMLSSAIISGLLSTGVKVVNAGLAPVPALSHVVMKDYDAGIMVTSSHNPPEYNGVKFILGDGVEISESEEKQFLELFKAEPIKAKWDSVGSLKQKDILEKYSNALIDSIHSETVKSRKFKVVVDTGNGAQSILIPNLYRELGCDVIELNTEPKGIFNRPSEPRPESLGELKEKVVAEKADFGIAFDCDGDRCIFVTEKGDVVMGDVTGSMFARELLKQNKGGKIITTVSTSKIIDDVASAEGGEVIRTIVGAKYVGEALINEKAIYGFEENGGNIFPDISYTREGSATAVKMLELLTKTDKTFSEVVAEFPKYYQVKLKVECTEDKKKDIPKLKDKVDRDNVEILTQDGVKVVFEDGSVLLRASGTEAILRVYAEANSKEKADEYAKWGEKLVKLLL